jgi:hypothetical protein
MKAEFLVKHIWKIQIYFKMLYNSSFSLHLMAANNTNIKCFGLKMSCHSQSFWNYWRGFLSPTFSWGFLWKFIASWGADEILRQVLEQLLVRDNQQMAVSIWKNGQSTSYFVLWNEYNSHPQKLRDTEYFKKGCMWGRENNRHSCQMLKLFLKQVAPPPGFFKACSHTHDHVLSHKSDKKSI